MNEKEERGREARINKLICDVDKIIINVYIFFCVCFCVYIFGFGFVCGNKICEIRIVFENLFLSK